MNDRSTSAATLALLTLGLAGCADRLTTEAALSADTSATAASTAVHNLAAAGCTVLESQSWWSTAPDIPLGGDSEHAHVEVCFPYRQVIDGQYTFTIVSRLHNVPGWYLRNVRVQAASDQDGNRTLANVSRTDLRCAGRDCTFTTPVTVDLSRLPAGEWEFRFHTEIRPSPSDPIINRATTGWVACVRSCSGRTPQAVPTRQTEARGWYREANGAERGYVNARFVDPLPAAPVSGSWCPRVRTLRGVGDESVTRTFISIDPSFHATPADPGRVVRNAAGMYDGRPCIDTTRLTNGVHRLFIRADWEAGPLAGALVVPFEVANP